MKRSFTIEFVALALGMAMTLAVRAQGGTPAPPGKTLEELVPQRVREQGYVSSSECKSCHEEEHASWHRSYHRTMTQLAAPGSVAGAFDGTSVVRTTNVGPSSAPPQKFCR